MTSRQTYYCQYCNRSDFRSQQGLDYHRNHGQCQTQHLEFLRQATSQGQDNDSEADDHLAPPEAPPEAPNREYTDFRRMHNILPHDMDDITIGMGDLFAQEANADDSVVSDDYDNFVDDFAESTTSESSGADDGSNNTDDTSNNSRQSEADVENPEQVPHEVEVTRGPNVGMRDQFLEYLTDEVPDFKAFTEDQEVAIRLLSSLRVKQVALRGYEEIMAWHLKESGKLEEHETIKDSPHYIPREKVLEGLAKRYNYENKYPKLKKIKLPVSGTVLHLTRLDPTAVIQGMLTDPRIGDADYFFFDDNPLAPPPKEKTYLREFQTGKAYYDTYKALKINPKKRQQLLGVPFYLDGAAITHFHDLELIQVKITLGFWNRKTREKEYAWATLGYIEKVHEQGGAGRDLMRESHHLEVQDASDSEDHSSNAESLDGVGTENAQDFHAMIACILEDFVDLQEHGFIWDFPYKGELYRDVHFKIFVPFVKCDNQEADKLCGKYLIRTTNVAQLCRACHVPTEQTNDHLHQPVHKTMPEVQNLVQQGDIEGLQSISQTYLLNGFYGLRFNRGNERGIHGACPYDMLHCLLLGVFKYLRDIFFSELGKASLVSRIINGLSKEYCKKFRRQSDKSLPKCNFSKGIKSGRLMGREYRGVLLVMLAVLRSTKGREVMRRSRKKRIATDVQADDWILMVETLLQWEAYLTQEEIKMSDVHRLRRKHRFIMYLMRRVAKRQEGMRMNFVKFHLIIHLVEDMILYGHPLEYDTSHNESHHKQSKQAGKRTQKSTSTFNYQTARRLTEYRLIELAMLEIERGLVPWDYFAGCQNEDVEAINAGQEVNMESPEASSQEDSSESSRRRNIFTGETRLRVYLDEDGEVQYKMLSRSKFVDKTRWNSELVDWLYELQVTIGDVLLDYKLPICTCHKREGQIFRGHPNYRGLGKWSDWVWVDWGAEGRLPSHIWCFVEIEGLDRTRRRLKYGGITLQDGVYAVVEVAYLQDIQEEIARSAILVPFMKHVDLDNDGTAVKRHFYLANTEAFDAPCACIPDVGGPPNRYFAVKSRQHWSDDFLDWVRMTHEGDEMDELDKYDEVIESENEDEASESDGSSESEDDGSENDDQMSE